MKYKYIFLILYNSSNNNINKINQDFLDFFRNFFFLKERVKADKSLTIRYYISLLQMFIEYYDKFDKILINAWNEEIKPYIFKYFPLEKQGQFFVNSDLVFVIEIIDSYKEKYTNKEIISENNDNKSISIEINSANNIKINNKNNTEIKINNKKIEKEEGKMFHKSLNFFH